MPNTKPVVRRSKEDALSKVSWHVAIFDEAHVLKEGTQKFNAAMRLNTMRRYGLTGTAMQVGHSPPTAPYETLSICQHATDCLSMGWSYSGRIAAEQALCRWCAR